MAKTNPIGVRFDEDLLAELKKEGYADSPQKALNLLETFYRFSRALNSRPITEKEIYKKPLDEKDCTDNSEIEKQIAEVKSRTKPEGMNQKVWEFDQNKRIKELKDKLI